MNRSTVAPTLMRTTIIAALALFAASCDKATTIPTVAQVNSAGNIEGDRPLHPLPPAEGISLVTTRSNISTGVVEVTGATANSVDAGNLANFDVVVHLDGITYGQPLSVSAQTTLQNWVAAGHGYVTGQWTGYERVQGYQSSMPELVMMSWGTGNSSNCGGCFITYETLSAGVGHPVMAGLPSSFTFFADGHDAGDPFPYGVNPPIALASANGTNAGVLVRNHGAGRAVNFSVAANYFNSASLQDANIQKLYANAAKWASGVANPKVLLLVDQGGAGTNALVAGLQAAGMSVTTCEPEYLWPNCTGAEPPPSDNTPPTITANVSGTVGTDGWYTSDVTVDWTVTDDESAYTATGCDDFTLTTDQSTTTYTCTATSAGGTATESVEIKIDKTGPTVGYSGNAGAYTVDQTVAITCSASDALSGLASSTCADVSGPAYTFALGANTFSASATDNAGNSASASTTFTVSVTSASLCALVQAWVTKPGVANSLCVKLTNAAAADARGDGGAADNMRRAFVNEVQAQAGKSVTAANAAILIQLAAAS